MLPVAGRNPERQPAFLGMRSRVDDGYELRVSGRHRLVELVAASRALARHASASHHEHGQPDQYALAAHSCHLARREFAIWIARSLPVYASIRVMVPLPLSKMRVLVARRSVSGYGWPLASWNMKSCGLPDSQ